MTRKRKYEKRAPLPPREIKRLQRACALGEQREIASQIDNLIGDLYDRIELLRACGHQSAVKPDVRSMLRDLKQFARSAGTYIDALHPPKARPALIAADLHDWI